MKFNIENQYAKVSINSNKKVKHYEFTKSDSDDHLKIKGTIGVQLLPYPVNFYII